MYSSIKKLTALLMCVVTICFSAPPIQSLAASTGSSAANHSVGADTAQSASTTYDDNVVISDNGVTTSNTDVYITVDDSGIKVGVPTTIILGGVPDATGTYAGKNTGRYSVSVEGDIAGTEKLVVEPDNTSITLSQTGNTNTPTATITQEQTEFNFQNLWDEDVVTGVIASQEPLTAGKWHGNFNFNIGIEQLTGEALFAAQGYSTLYSVDLSATSNDDVQAYYLVPTENTEEVSNNPISGFANLTSNFLNIFKPITVFGAEEIITKNGVEYTLSDDDKLVIQGSGNITNDVLSKLNDGSGLCSNIKSYLLENNACSAVLSVSYSGTTITFSRNGYNEKLLYNIATDTFSTTGSSTYGSVFSAINVTRGEFESLVRERYTEVKSTYIKSIPKQVVFKAGVSSVRGFRNVDGMEDIIIESGITRIEDAAFYECRGIKTLSLPNTINYIGPQAFYNCSNLLDVVLPEGINTIKSQLFKGCSSLLSVTIPDTVTSIENYAFENCSSLDNVSLPAGLTRAGQAVFRGCTSLTSITIPGYIEPGDSYEPALWYICDGCTSLNTVVIEDGLSVIGTSAFAGCSSLTSVTIPSSMRIIYNNAFKNCSNLSVIKLSSNITFIDSDAFVNLAPNSIIYCETQAVADKLEGKYSTNKTTIVVDATQFS